MWGQTIIRKVLGSRNQRTLKRLQQVVHQINGLEPAMQALTDAELQAKTAAFQAEWAAGKSLDQLLPEAFAVVREASRRVLQMRHFDVQLVGGMVLHHRQIAEMRMGEGKTLVATLPAYLNALTGKGVHIVTVNDYLARRDAEWMGRLYRFLGLRVGVVVHGMSAAQKQAAYAADITYGTNNEFGFDYLRDNMAFTWAERVQRPLHYAIVDEVDSILIDEARTPLIISGPAEDSSEWYQRMDMLAKQLIRQRDEETEGDYTVDEKQKQVILTELGHIKAEQLMVEAGLLPSADASLYDPHHIVLLHHLYAALKANALFHRDVDYIVQRQEVVIVDEHTGRTMPGRRWSEGLHQAVEAKEKVPILPENQTLASITFQNYFRLYEKLCGMTGTADTEAYEFQEIYGLEVVVIPPNRPNRRQDFPDLVYLTADAKFQAIIQDIKACLGAGRPVLVGTASIEASEYLSGLLQQEKIAHRVLNAKFHEQEADIVAEAGRPGHVTLATNMAGRGTDIVLGGSLDKEWSLLPIDAPAAEREAIRQAWQARHDAVVAAGGLHVIGSERHESRRIDNQLRGRSGRQGDPGSSRFYLSMDDHLMRIFASPHLKNMMVKLGLEPDQAIESRMVTRAIESAQRKVEARNFDIRKQLLQYDDVANEQRQIIYEQRLELMQAQSVEAIVHDLVDDVIAQQITAYMPHHTAEAEWDIPGLAAMLEPWLQHPLPLQDWIHQVYAADPPGLVAAIQDAVYQAYREKSQVAPETVRQAVEKNFLLHVLDTEWKEHLVAMDHLRQGIHLRGYAQKDPKQEYKREAFALFESMLDRFKNRVVEGLCTWNWQAEIAPPPLPTLSTSGLSEVPEIPPRKWSRNAPCPCGSGKKYKYCCGKLETTGP